MLVPSLPVSLQFSPQVSQLPGQGEDAGAALSSWPSLREGILHQDFRFKPQESWVDPAPCPTSLDPTTLAAAVWDRRPGTQWQLSWEVTGHGENAGAEGH